MEQNKTAYLSALGSMGRRHLIGLVKAGFDVDAFDPNIEAQKQAFQELRKNQLEVRKLRITEQIKDKYDVAIFAETAPSRLKNFNKFINISNANKYFLEKPISANPEEAKIFYQLAREKGIDNKIQVNMIRRAWPHIRKINDFCKNEEYFVITVNGGAVGLGCNGIHFLDNFILFSQEETPQIKWVKLNATKVKSGRGEEFEDYGGDFVLETSRGVLLGSLSSYSSSNISMSIKGKNSLIIIDYQQKKWKIYKKNNDSKLPLHRYGADYSIFVDEDLKIPNTSQITADWANGVISLPDLKLSMNSHLTLFELLKVGGVKPPYKFT